MYSAFVLSITLALVLAAPAVLPEAAASRFKYYNMPTAAAGPCDLANGPDGLIWGEDVGIPSDLDQRLRRTQILSNNIFTIDQKTGVVKEYPIPYTGDALPITNLPTGGPTGNRGAFACAIRPGADGYMYAASGVRNQLVKICVKTKKMTILNPPGIGPLGNLQPFNDLWTLPNGMLFTQTTGNVITYYDYKSGHFTNYQVPTPLAGPLGMYVASDGWAYFTEFFANKIGRFNHTSGEIQEFPVVNPLGAGPAVIRAETPGLIWFTALEGGSMGSFNMYNHEIKLYPNNIPASLPSEDTVSPDGRVWFSTIAHSSINYVMPSTGKVVNIEQPANALPAPVSLPLGLEVAVNYRGGYIWFTDTAYNRVGTYKL